MCANSRRCRAGLPFSLRSTDAGRAGSVEGSYASFKLGCNFLFRTEMESDDRDAHPWVRPSSSSASDPISGAADDAAFVTDCHHRNESDFKVKQGSTQS